MSSKNRDTGTFSTVNVAEKAILAANSVNILELFKLYGINIDEEVKKTFCPFHKGGNERTPSFIYFQERNGFYCFGCNTGGGPVDFVSLYENITRYAAALKINQKLFSSSEIIIESRTYKVYNFYLEFSHSVRKFIHQNKLNFEAIKHAEYICSLFDEISQRFKIEEDGFQMLIDNLLAKLDGFKCQF